MKLRSNWSAASPEGPVVAGSAKDKTQAFASHIMPETMKANQHRKESEPGSANK